MKRKRSKKGSGDPDEDSSAGVPAADLEPARTDAASDEPPTEIVPPAPAAAVLYEVDGTAAVITFHRPERRNAINDDVIAGLHDALDRALDDERVRGVVLTGAGNTFSAGVDLHDVIHDTALSYEEHLADAEALARLFRRLRSFEKVTVAAVNGPAFGSGCGLSTLCDFTLAVPEARFGYPEVRFGFVPAIVAVYLRGLVNEKHFRDLLLTGRTITAETALEFGLVSELVEPDALLRRGTDIVAEVAANAPLAIRMTKELLEVLPGLDMDRALKAAVDANARMRESAECREGIQAFLDKRAPDWTAANAPDAAPPDG